MTGFATAERALPTALLSVELKTVNSRFLDLNLRVADDLRAHEAAVREALTAGIARGKVDCRVGLQRSTHPRAPRLNAQALVDLQALMAQVRAILPDAAMPSAEAILTWPGVVETDAADPDEIRHVLLDALGDALASLQQTRQREGDALRTILLDRTTRVEAIAGEVQARVPQLLALQERRLVERLEQALGPLLSGAGSMSRDDINERIRQEVTLYGLRADVDEEIKRLLTHVNEVCRVLAAGGAVGRRLDFLMQELNREANTLGAKASAIELTQAAVELKILIEQMREQIQNLE